MINSIPLIRMNLIIEIISGLTNPEQLNKFMTISGILCRQNSSEINLTNAQVYRDFNPKDWGCRN